MISQIPTSLPNFNEFPQSINHSNTQVNPFLPITNHASAEPFNSDSKSTETHEPKEEIKPDVKCYLCFRILPTIKKRFKCKACKQIICKVHSVTLQESRSFRICDNCEIARLNAKDERHALDEKKYVIRQKIRYYNEEIERKQHDITFKSLCVAKLQSIIKKSQADWETKQLDLLDKIQREKAQNGRLDTIAENLKKAVASSQENTQHIVQAHNKYNTEIDSTRNLSEVVTREIFTLMSEVDKFNQTLKKKVPIYKLSSLTCPNCCSEILKNCKTQEGSLLESDGKISRNLSIMDKLQEMHSYDQSKCSKPCKCIIF